MEKSEHKINDVVKLHSGQIAVIVGTTTLPYHSPLFKKDEYPKEGYDYIILLKDKMSKHKNEFLGKEFIKQSDIKSYIKRLYD